MLYFVSAYSGGPGPSAYSAPDSGQAGTTYSYDGLGRVLSTTDALSNITRQSYTGGVLHGRGRQPLERTQVVDVKAPRR